MKKRIGLMFLCLFLLSVQLLAAGCDTDNTETVTTEADTVPITEAIDPNNPHNVSVKQVYFYVGGFTCMFRTDFNEYGKTLGTTMLNWHNLTPTRSLSVYRYDADGKLAFHSVLGTSLSITTDENGLPVRGNGYDIIAYYTFREDGSILSERIRDGGSDKYVLEYDNFGLLSKVKTKHTIHSVVQWDDIPIIYLDNEVQSIEDETTYSLKLDPNGLPTELFKDDDTWSLCRWTYDESGNCVSFDGRDANRVFRKLLKAEMTYDASGNLLTYQADYTDNDLEDYTYTYTYNESGSLIRSEKIGTKSDVSIVYENGKTVSEIRTQYESENGNKVPISIRETRMNGDTETLKAYTIQEGGARILTESGTYLYDDCGRVLEGLTKYYKEGGVLSMEIDAARTFYDDGSYETFAKTVRYDNDGEFRSLEELTIKRDCDGILLQRIDRKFPEIGSGGDETIITEYENGKCVKQTTTYLVEDGGLYEMYEGDLSVLEIITYVDDDTICSIYREKHEDGVLTSTKTTYYHPLVEEEDIVYKSKTTTYKTSEDGAPVREEQDLIRYKNHYEDITTTVYLNDVPASVTYEMRSPNRYETDEYYTMSRVDYKLVRIFSSNGSLETVTESRFDYYDSGRIKKVSETTTDADGVLIDTVIKEYDESGKLIS